MWWLWHKALLLLKKLSLNDVAFNTKFDKPKLCFTQKVMHLTAEASILTTFLSHNC